MKKPLTVALLLTLALSCCAPALAVEKVPKGRAISPLVARAGETPAPTALLEQGSPEEDAEALAAYHRFVSLCRERGETVLDTAFEDQGVPENQFGLASGSVLYFTPMEGVQVTVIPSFAMYYLQISDPEDPDWTRQRLLWADMMRALDPALDKDRANQAIDDMLAGLSEAHAGSGVWDGQVNEGDWSHMVIASPGGSTLMSQRTSEVVDLSGLLSQPEPRPGDAQATERLAAFRALLETQGLTLLPLEDPMEAEVSGFLYSGYRVSDTVDWIDVFDPETGVLMAHYVMLYGQPAAKEGITDLTRGVLQAALMAKELPEAEAAALLPAMADDLAESDQDGDFSSTAETADGRPVLLRITDGSWSVMVAFDE